LGKKVKPGANFEFSGAVTETLGLGNVALRTDQKVIWDGANLKAVNAASVEQYLRPQRRSGWTL
jgi:hypothetical protein